MNSLALGLLQICLPIFLSDVLARLKNNQSIHQSINQLLINQNKRNSPCVLIYWYNSQTP